MMGLIGLALAAWAAPNVVLVSLDTTRADALSCAGLPPGAVHAGLPTTPNLDALAAGGVRFTSAWTHAPTTLSAHASLFTGLDPHGHAVVRNGFPLDPSLPLLAEHLRDGGWDTVAVIGAAALERSMGLDRGFRVYDDDTPELQGLMYQDRAEGVVTRALAHADAATEPLFLFAHFFDAHSPYAAPEAWRSRFLPPGYTGPYADPAAPLKPLVEAHLAGTADPADLAAVTGHYLAEVAYVDDQVGRLLHGLRGRGLLDDAIVVVVGDHGEVLSEDAAYAWSHGSDIGAGAMQIPLLVHGAGVARRAVVRSQVALSDLAPTLLELVGQPGLGTGFAHLVRPGPVWDADGWPERPTRTVFMEATRPRSLEPEVGWNNLRLQRGVRAGGFHAVGTPAYDEPLELSAAGRGGALALPWLAALVQRWDAAAPERREEDMAPATRRALEALGYLDD